MDTKDTEILPENTEEMGLRAVKTTVLEPGLESVRYEGKPLPSHFSIEDRINFYLNK